jgi:hypothetical protein
VHRIPLASLPSVTKAIQRDGSRMNVIMEHWWNNSVGLSGSRKILHSIPQLFGFSFIEEMSELVAGSDTHIIMSCLDSHVVANGLYTIFS